MLYYAFNVFALPRGMNMPFVHSTGPFVGEESV